MSSGTPPPSFFSVVKSFVEEELPKVAQGTSLLSDSNISSPSPWSVDSKAKSSTVIDSVPFKGSFTGKRPQVRLGGGANLPSTKAGGLGSLHSVAEGSEDLNKPLNIDEEAVKYGVTPLYLAVYHLQYDLVKQLLRQGHNPNTKVDPKGLPFTADMKQRLRINSLPSVTLELAVASNDSRMVDVLMDGGALLQIPKQLTLEQMKEKAKALAKPKQRGRLKTSGSMGLGWGDDGLGDSFLEDEEVQQTLRWRDHEASLLSHANSHIVERILRRQSYQLSLSMSSTPQAINTIFEHAVAQGNLYVLKAMLDKGVDINAPTFHREQYPLCVSINTLQPNLMKELLKLGAKGHDEKQDLFHMYVSVKKGGASAQMWYPLPDACLMFLLVADDIQWPSLQQELVDDERLQLAVQCVEVLLEAGVKVQPDLVDRLAEEAPLRQQPKSVRDRYCALLRIIVGQEMWSPETHKWYPKKLQDKVKLMLFTSVNPIHTAAADLLSEVIEEGEEEGEETQETQETVARDDVSSQTVARDDVSFETVAIDDVSSETVARDDVSSETVARDDVSSATNGTSFFSASSTVAQQLAQMSVGASSQGVGSVEEGTAGVEGQEEEEEEEEEMDVFANASPEDLLKIQSLVLPMSKWF